MTDQKQDQGKDFFSGLPESRQHMIALAILFVIPFIVFTATTIGGKDFSRHDIVQWRAGAESVIDYRETYDREPLWVSNMFLGMPAYVVSTKTAVPHLDNLGRLFRDIFPAFQYWVMLFGMYVLLITIGLRKLSSVFGSIIYGLTTYFPVIIVAGHSSKFAALGFAPWVVAGYWMISRSDKKVPLSGLLLFCVSLALEFRAGHPQITYYLLYLLGILWLTDTWSAVRSGKISNWALTTALLIGGGIVGALGNADRLLILREYAEFSIRGGSALDAGSSGLETGYAFTWSQGIRETLTLFIPDLFGGSGGTYWGPKPGTSGPHYLGALTLPFVLIALLKDRRKMIYAFFAAGVLGILFAWGRHFPLLNEFAFDYIPFFNKFRAPETWLILTALSWSVVAAYGADWLAEQVEQKELKLNKLYAPLGAAVAFAVIIVVSVGTMDFQREGELRSIAGQIAQQNQVSPDDPRVIQRAEQYIRENLVPEREEKANRDMIRFLLLLAAGGGIMFLLTRDKMSASVGLMAFIAVGAFDMVQVDKRYIPEQSIIDGNIDAERLILSQRKDLDEFLAEKVDENSNYPYRVFPLLDGPFNNAVPSYFYPTVGGYTGAKMSITQDVIDQQTGKLFSGPSGLNLQLLSLMNVKYITYNPGLGLPGLQPVFTGQQGVVYENTEVYPKAFFVDSVITVQDPREAFNYLDPGVIDLRRTAVVETSEQLMSTPDTTSSVEVTQYTGPEMSFELSRTEPGFLVISEVYYPAGWIAYLDGEEVPIHKTDYLFRGVEIPAGDHTLRMEFRPQTYQTGTLLAWISLGIQILLAGFAGFSYYSKKS